MSNQHCIKLGILQIESLNVSLPWFVYKNKETILQNSNKKIGVENTKLPCYSTI